MEVTQLNTEEKERHRCLKEWPEKNRSVRVTKSVIFPGDYGFALNGGEIYKVPADCPLPETLRLYSEP